MIIYACDEHIEEAMDDIINENEVFPVINKCEGHKCTYCNKESIYDIKS